MANTTFSQIILFVGIIFLFTMMFLKYPEKLNIFNTNYKSNVQHIPHPSVKAIKNPNHHNSLQANDKIACYDPNMQTLNSKKKEYTGNKYDDEGLASFYIPAKDTIPEDYPVKQIGECPYSKMQARDVPIGNVPQCMAEKDNYNMRIELYQHNK